MRNSIRFKMTSILILIVGWVIVFTWFLNNTFSEKYYVSSEKASIVKTFDKVKNILKNEENQDTIDEEMEQISNKTNIKMMIAQSSNYYYSQNVIFSNLIDGSKTYEEILGYLDQIRSQVILGNDKGNFKSNSGIVRFSVWSLFDWSITSSETLTIKPLSKAFLNFRLVVCFEFGSTMWPFMIFNPVEASKNIEAFCPNVYFISTHFKNINEAYTKKYRPHKYFG